MTIDQHNLNFSVTNEEWQRTPQSVQEIVATLLQETNRVRSENGVLQHTIQAYRSTAIKVAKKLQVTQRQVVFIVDTLTSRQAKLAYGLQQIGWSVILLCKSAQWLRAQKYFSEVHLYSTADQALELCLQFSPVVYHLFSSWGFDTAQMILQHKPGKVVFDNYDLFVGAVSKGYEKNVSHLIEPERFCLENADALCNRNLLNQIPKRKFAYKLSKYQIFFPDYCWDRIEDYSKSPTAKPNDELHVAFAGNIIAEWFDDPDPISVVDRGFIAGITEQRIHYHLYIPLGAYGAPENFPVKFAKILEYSKSNPYFHVYQHVPADELIGELSRHHIGLIGISSKVPEVGDPLNLPIAIKYLATNKAFDYIDAGLQVLISGAPLIEWLLSRNRVGERAFREAYPHVLGKYTPTQFDLQFQNKITMARRKLSVWRHAPRLAKFYTKVASEG